MKTIYSVGICRSVARVSDRERFTYLAVGSYPTADKAAAACNTAAHFYTSEPSPFLAGFEVGVVFPLGHRVAA